jgi:hypothetical protein
MAAGIDAVLDKLAQATITNILAPYQPNLSGYPNASPLAGGIPSTLVTAGHPLQIKVMERLENKMSQVAIYDAPPEKIFPYVNAMPIGTDGNGNAVVETAASSKKVVFEIWTYDRTSLAKIRNILRSQLGDFFRQTEADGTISLFRYNQDVPLFNEQKDSVYIVQLHYMCDFTVTTTLYAGTDVTEASLTVTEETIGGSEIASQTFTVT